MQNGVPGYESERHGDPKIQREIFGELRPLAGAADGQSCGQSGKGMVLSRVLKTGKVWKQRVGRAVRSA